MPISDQQQEPDLPKAGQFNTTRWSLILAAAESQDARSRRALEQLCHCYWQPVYAFVRRNGAKPEDAADLTQSFFAELLEDKVFARADPAKGRFRSFLLGALKHFLANERRREAAQKRGGKIEFVPLDVALAESRYGANLPQCPAPEAQFDRAWALAILDRALARLRVEFERAGRGPLWKGLKGFLLGDGTARTFAAAAAELRITEGAAKMTVTRLRRRFYALVRQEISETVSEQRELEQELNTFFQALQN